MQCCPSCSRQHRIRKILCRIVLILLAQHCTCQNPVQCCLRGYRQYFIRKNPVQCWLNTLGTTSHRSKPYAMFSEWLQRTLHKKKSGFALGTHCPAQNPMQCCLKGTRQLWIRKKSVQCCFNTLGTTLHWLKPFAMLSERLQKTLHKKKSYAMLSSFSLYNIAHVKTLCSVVQEVSGNIL